MKNKGILFLTVILAAALMMAGCGGDSTGKETEKPTSSSGSASSSGNTSSSGNVGANAQSEDGFIFESDGTKVVMNAEAADIIKALGEEKDYFEAESCAFKGIDKTYTYSGFRLYTYPVDEVDYVLSVDFMDDSVSTTEGISIGNTKEKVIEVYGEDYEESGSGIVYTKGKSQLKFILDDSDGVSSIEYLAVTD